MTVDAFPPEEGTYLVSYDFDALDSEGFKVKGEDPEANTIICMPRSCPRCRMVVTREQYKKLIDAMIVRTRGPEAAKSYFLGE